MRSKLSKNFMAKDLGFTTSPLRIYINENLTPGKRKLAMKVRMSFKNHGCSVWTRNCKIYVAKKVSSEERDQINRSDPKYKVYKIEEEQDIIDIKRVLLESE